MHNHPIPATNADVADSAASGHQSSSGTISHLQQIDLFDGLSPTELVRLARAFTPSSALPGQHIDVQDAPVRWWSLIMDGHALVERDRTALGLLGHGESWSEHSLLNGMRSPISVVALSPLRLLSLTERQFTDLPDSCPTLAQRIAVRSASSADRLALPVHRALLHMDRALLRQAQVTGEPIRGR